jgi:hypothetical protein
VGLRGGEGRQAAVVVGEVEVERGVEARELEPGVMRLHALVRGGVGGVEGADVPGEGLRGVVLEVGHGVG